LSDFKTIRLPVKPTIIAPDGSDVRVLLKLTRGSLAHFELAPRKISKAGAHRTVEEIWFFLNGRGEIWRKSNNQEEIVTVEEGVCITIPLGTHFQFRANGNDPLSAIGVTMPPWPNEEEWYEVKGKWVSNLECTT
jgi:mannose-6-phosphate isomerase-like protein (cupin superfamily)